ncbi:MAG TPA: MFS transporter [Pseudonocardiaceae bacterium]
MSRPGSRVGLVALLGTRAVSMLGGQVSTIAIPWLVLTTTGDPAQMGLVIAARMVPYLLAGLFGTPLADRIGILRTTIIADLVSMCAVATIAAVPGVGMPVILAMVAVSGTVRGVGDRTETVLLRPLVEAAGAKLPRMTAVYTGIGSVAAVLGAPASGVLVAWIGPQQALWVTAVCVGLCAPILALFVHPPADLMPERRTAEPYLVAVRGGARHLRQDRLLMLLLTMTFLTNAVNQAMGALFIPLWVDQVFGTPAALGVVFGTSAAGAVVGNLIFIALAQRLPRFLTFALCLTISGVPRLLVLALSQDLALVLAVTFVSGVAVSAVNPILGILLYERVPNELQTRVFGLVTTVTYTGFPIGGVLGGLAVAGFGLTGALLVGAGIYLATTTIPMLRLRTADRAASADRAAADDAAADDGAAPADGDASLRRPTEKAGPAET